MLDKPHSGIFGSQKWNAESVRLSKRALLKATGAFALASAALSVPVSAATAIDVRYGGCKSVKISNVTGTDVVTVDISYVDENGDGRGPVPIPATPSSEDPSRYPHPVDGPLTVRYLENQDTTFVRIDGGRNTAIRQITANDSAGDTVTTVQNPKSDCIQNSAPTAQFTASSATPILYEEVTFDASESGDSDGEIVLYEWDFDSDGTVDHVSSLPSDAVYTYQSIGMKDVTLTVMDDLGGTGSVTNSISVGLPQNGLRLWLRADEGVVESGGDVSMWQDQSGNHYDFTTADETERPALVSNAVNGRAALRFDGTGDRLQNESTLGIPNDSGRTFFVVCKYDQAVLDQGKRSPVLMQGLTGSSTNHYGFEGNSYRETDNRNYVYLVGSSYRTSVELDATYNVHTLRTTTFPAWEDIASTTTYYVNGVDSGSLSEITYNHVDFNGDTSTLGSFAHRAESGYSSHHGDIAEVLAYDEALSDDERRVVEQYLSEKYGL
ncbi:PKD domain-containing protein [Halogeometricum sp. S1BR25-6]|uniref:PKD domain-containing protein n=1 Tax=Halogeometricum salsisoli TaxID=2950536 RepID=A0ABU2GJN7_9EURY|nr:PKD domain-containing protein [Halogeometricum sp. S1BR25-6]MDS0301030.1 PKD domain-containing protein [Halogeometricum sp. S1BR25-6]